MRAVCWRSSWLAIWSLATIRHNLLVLLTHEHHSWPPAPTLALKVCPAGSLHCLSSFPCCLRTTHDQSLAAIGETPNRHGRCVVKLLNFLGDSSSSHKAILFLVLLELACTILSEVSCGVTKVSPAVILCLVGSTRHSNWGLACGVFSWLDEGGRSCRVWCVEGWGEHSSRFLLRLVDAVYFLALLHSVTNWCPNNFLAVACLWCNRSSTALRRLRVWHPNIIVLLSNMAEACLSATLSLCLWTSTIVATFDVAWDADWRWRIHHLFHVLLVEHTLAHHLRPYLFRSIATPDIFLMSDLNALVILVLGLFAGLRIWTTGEPINTWWISICILLLVHWALTLIRKVCVFRWGLHLVIGGTDLRAADHRWGL